MDKFTGMRIFVKVVEMGSFSAAAAILNISPQMVAKHIAYLETELSTVLLTRTTRRQSLTDIGRSYYERCRLILAEMEAADAMVFAMHSQPKGILKVSAPVTFGAFSLPPFISRYLAMQPEMEIDLSLSDRLVDPLEEDIDIMIRIGELADSSMIARPLRPYRLIACASPDYLAARGVPHTPAELAQHVCLIYANGILSASCSWSFSRNGKTEQAVVRGRYRSNNWQALLHAATAGMGITLGPETALYQEIRSGRLVPILEHYQGPVKPMSVVYPSSRRPTVKLRSFVEALVDEFGDKPGMA